MFATDGNVVDYEATQRSTDVSLHRAGWLP